ncbi:MAG: ORF6N domain-containing protein [Clostridia bacterium]|nr:ORF6N domain-containing protein [Clostridia bacterium]
MNEENNITPVNEELNVVEYEADNIKNLIYTIRGKQVMLDSDVARLFEYETKDINRNVKNNIDRFPEYYCFQLTENEYEALRCKFFTLKGRGKHRKYLPYVFTEHGITMLAGILKSRVAINVSIKIVDTFVEMRKLILNNGQVFERLTTMEYKMLEHDKKFEEVFDELQRNKNEEFKQQVFFNGQIYDSYSLIIDIIKTAQKKILIIDNYIDDSILKMLAKKNKSVEVVILTSEKSNITKLDIQKFNKEYATLKVAKTDKFHDRFIAIDNKELYHIGASLKDLGKKCFAISKIEDREYLEKISNLA